jgi:hypothetical protein
MLGPGWIDRRQLTRGLARANHKKPREHTAAALVEPLVAAQPMENDETVSACSHAPTRAPKGGSRSIVDSSLLPVRFFRQLYGTVVV